MSLSEEEQTTENTYRDIARKWNDLHPVKGHHDLTLVEFKKHLEKGLVLEIGCAAGKDSEMLTSAGYQYVGTDAVQEFVDIAKKTYPNRTFSTCRAQDIGNKFKENSFDGLWCSATLLHVPREQIGSTLKGIKKVLKPGAIAMISLQKGTGEKFELGYEKTDGKGRLFVYYTKESFEKLLNEIGFVIVYFEHRPRAERPDWLQFIIRNNK